MILVIFPVGCYLFPISLPVRVGSTYADIGLPTFITLHYFIQRLPSRRFTYAAGPVVPHTTPARYYRSSHASAQLALLGSPHAFASAHAALLLYVALPLLGFMRNAYS